jgi:hypothetical protein
MEKGMIFSIDSMVSFTLILIILLGFIFSLNNYALRVHTNSKNFYLEEKTLTSADSFVKNHSTNNGLFGIAIFDFDKKRVKNNQLSIFLAAPFTEYFEEDGFFVKQISIEKNVFFKSEKIGIECVTLKRFVLFESKKSIVEYTGCLNK